MDSTENKPPEDSILCSNSKELFLVMLRAIGIFFFFTYVMVAGAVVIVWAGVLRKIMHSSYVL
jgi:hypothetical protein